MKNTINKIVDNCDDQLALLTKSIADAIFDENEERVFALNAEIDKYLFMKNRLKFLKTTITKIK